MSEAKRKKALYIFLAAAVVFGVYNFSTPRKHYIPGGLAQPESETATVQSAAPTQPPVDRAASEKANWGRDPFTWSTRTQSQPRHNRVTVSAEPNPTWQLSAIVFSASNPLAVVNGKTVRIGDVVDRAQVVKIDRNKVTLRLNGSDFEIRTSKG